MNSIEVQSLSKKYNHHLAVDNLTFSIESGSIFGLLGPNGAGKSTTIKMLTTLLPPTSGSALINGFDLIQQPQLIRSHIGYVPQALSVDRELTGYENLLISSKLYGIPSSEREERIEEMLQFMHLFDERHLLVHHYSGGMIRRLEIGMALLHKPRVLFLDEPTVGLDPAARLSLWKYIQEWRKNIGTTIFLTTHDMDEADRLCDIVAFMHKGKIVAMDKPQNLKAALGPKATLDHVFIEYTGTSIKEEGNHDSTEH